MKAVGDGTNLYRPSLHKIQLSFLGTLEKRITRGAPQAVLVRQPDTEPFNYDHTTRQAA